jgi:hypothetical protein
MVVAILPMAGLIMGQVPDRASFALERSLMISRIRERVRASSKDAASRELERALTAMASVERERFVPESSRADAYGDTPLPIGYDQTISDAYVVAVMTAALRLPAHANVSMLEQGPVTRQRCWLCWPTPSRRSRSSNRSLSKRVRG